MSDWTLWQSSETGTVAGITGSVDLDEFNGSLTDLMTFVNPTAAMPDLSVPGDASTTTVDAATTAFDAATSSSTPDAGTQHASRKSGCSCEVGGRPSPPSWMVLPLLASIAVRRRRARAVDEDCAPTRSA